MTAWLVGTVAGYGHITPRTDGGRLVTMLYAIFGIPLTLYALTNLGFIMATAFRFLYKYICCGLCCLCCSESSERETMTSTTDGTTDDGAEKLAGPARRAVLFLRGRRRHQHVDVTECAATANTVDDDKAMGWRQRLDAVFAETVDINQVIIWIWLYIPASCTLADLFFMLFRHILLVHLLQSHGLNYDTVAMWSTKSSQRVAPRIIGASS